jgi:hypothetical protein
MSKEIKLYDRVALVRDIPDGGLKKGDVATVIERVAAPGVEDGYILEVFNALGDTIMVVDVPVSAVEPITADYIPAVRPLIGAAS